ncbi:DegT/DnrJ/EryC1/StrS family aminotransferase [Microbacteriaceae bacterium VKM Ac-2855]|nr:DegT/DnrJ/EryC1/StrS family aminotransferase [Microbacteriaceae bacterium VKM Ac-2855]
MSSARAPLTHAAVAAAPTVVPFADLALLHRRVEHRIRSAIERVLDDSAYVLGHEVDAFERSFADYCGVPHAIGVGNGTDALELALRAAGLRPGDDVLVPANSFVATAEGVVRAGGVPVFVDCDDDGLIDVEDAVRARTLRTRAVMAVHLYGQCAPIELLREALGPEVIVVEDAAQAQGARRNWARAGSLGDVAGTSFYPGKNLGAYGDGGAVLTPDAEIADRVRMLRNHGGIARYEHRIVGTNSRLDGLQAAILAVKLEQLDRWNDERRAAAEYYAELLGDVPGVELPRTAIENEHVFHLYVIRLDDRDRMHDALAAAGIGTGVHYPTPIHRLAAFASPTQRTLPRAESQARRILSLPMFPGITRPQQEYVADNLSAVLGARVPFAAAVGA